MTDPTDGPSTPTGAGGPSPSADAPVVTSSGTSTEEVAGGAAVLADPLDVDSIAAALAEALHRRDELVALGLERARAFTWDAAADALEALWRELA